MSRSCRKHPYCIICGNTKAGGRKSLKRMYSQNMRQYNHIDPLDLDEDNDVDVLPGGNYYKRYNDSYDIVEYAESESWEQYKLDRIADDTCPVWYNSDARWHIDDDGVYHIDKVMDKPYYYADHLDKVFRDYYKFYLRK